MQASSECYPTSGPFFVADMQVVLKTCRCLDHVSGFKHVSKQTHGFHKEHVSHDNGDIWIMQLSLKRHPEQAALPLLRICWMIQIIDSVSKGAAA
jgi:hypothetical protein